MTTKGCSAVDQRLEGGMKLLGFGLQELWRGSEPRCKALPYLRNIKTGFIAASIHYQTDCPGPSLARVIAPRLSALVSAAPR
jgi:hypothetical protein